MVAIDIFDSFSRKPSLEDGFIFQLRWVDQKNYVLRGISLWLKGETVAAVVKEGTAFLKIFKYTILTSFFLRILVDVVSSIFSRIVSLVLFFGYLFSNFGELQPESRRSSFRIRPAWEGKTPRKNKTKRFERFLFFHYHLIIFSFIFQ